MLKEQQQDYDNISDRMHRMREFLIMLLESIDGGGRVVTFQDHDIEELQNLVESEE